MGFTNRPGHPGNLRTPEQTKLALVARHLDDMRRHGMEAHKLLDELQETRINYLLAGATVSIDDSRAMLAEKVPE